MHRGRKGSLSVQWSTNECLSVGGSGHRGFHASPLVSEAPRLPGWTASCVSGESKQTSASQCMHSKAFLNCSRIHTHPSPQPCPGLAPQFPLLLSLSPSFSALQQPPFSFPSCLHLLMCQHGPPATQLTEESVPCLSPLSALCHTGLFCQ